MGPLQVLVNLGLDVLHQPPNLYGLQIERAGVMLMLDACAVEHPLQMR